jgi:hypothetical protein
MQKAVLAGLILTTLLVAGIVRRSVPMQQTQTVMSSLLFWSSAINRYIGEQCSAGSTIGDVVEADLSLLTNAFTNFGLAWTYSGQDQLTTVTVDSNLSQNTSLSPARAVGLITVLAGGTQIPAGSVTTLSTTFNHRRVTTNTISGDPLYRPILIYHQSTNGGSCG